MKSGLDEDEYLILEKLHFILCTQLKFPSYDVRTFKSTQIPQCFWFWNVSEFVHHAGENWKISSAFGGEFYIIGG